MEGLSRMEIIFVYGSLLQGTEVFLHGCDNEVDLRLPNLGMRDHPVAI